MKTDKIKLISGLLLVLVIFITFNSFFSIVRVNGTSMNPTLKHNELAITTRVKTGSEIERYDIVVVQSHKTNNMYWVKRVIGLPGDTIELVNGQLYVNNTKIEESYIKKATETNYGNDEKNNVSIKLLDDQYYVLGDNRDNSTDSRSVGVFFLEDIRFIDAYTLHGEA